MKHLTVSLIVFFLAVGLMSCTNSNTSAPEQAVETKPVTPGEKSIIVDVRTMEEWDEDGHAACSVNYPLNELETRIESLKAYDKVIVVCRSGSRAGTAKELLEQAGIKNVENKGAWQNIDCK